MKCFGSGLESTSQRSSVLCDPYSYVILNLKSILDLDLDLAFFCWFFLLGVAYN